MERLPLPDASLDCLMSVYAFHEMPETARAAAAAEFFRCVCAMCLKRCVKTAPVEFEFECEEQDTLLLLLLPPAIQSLLLPLPLPCLPGSHSHSQPHTTAPHPQTPTSSRRVLKPGGLVVLADSVQLGDRPAWDPTLGAFGNMNEPHFRSYIACDLGSLFADAGFTCEDKVVCSATKSLSFTKPANGQFASSSGSSDGVAGAEELSSTEAQGLVGYSPN